MLSKDDIQHIAGLVRIDVTDEEKEEFCQNLSSILDYVSRLKEAESKVDENALRKDALFNVFREDKQRDVILEGDGENLVNMAPDKKGGYVKVKKVL